MARKAGKYQKKSKAMPLISWILLAAVVLSLGAGSVVAWLSLTDGHVENSFKPDSSTDPSIAETFESNVKSDVCVDIGDIDYAVYVRAAIVVHWKDDVGNVFAQAPVEGTHYDLRLNCGKATDPWFLGSDGFYYHREMVMNTGDADAVAPNNGTTNILISSCSLKSRVTPPDGYHLSVEIIAQTIQALGTTDSTDSKGIPAVEDAWKVVTVNDNNELELKQVSN